MHKNMYIWENARKARKGATLLHNRHHIRAFDQERASGQIKKIKMNPIY